MNQQKAHPNPWRTWWGRGVGTLLHLCNIEWDDYFLNFRTMVLVMRDFSHTILR